MIQDSTHPMADEDGPNYYAWGEPVVVRGVEFGPEVTQGGQEYTQWYAHVQFAEQTETTRIHPNVLSVTGGASEMYDDFVKRGFMPEWLVDNVTPPWDDEGVPDPDEKF